MQDDVDAGASGDVDPLVLHADERNEQHVLGRIGHVECELTVHVGTRTEVGAFDNDRSADNGLSVSTLDPPLRFWADAVAAKPKPNTRVRTILREKFFI